MTGIFQIFDRYKARLYVKNEPRKAKNGESETKGAPAYYLVEEDGVARKVTPEAAELRQARSEASKDSRRSSSADANDMQVKSSTPPRVVESPRVIDSSVGQSPQSKRSLARSEPSSFVATPWSPQAIQKLQLKKVSNETSSQGEIETPKSAEAAAFLSRGAGSGGDGPVARSAAKDGFPKLPPRAGGGGARALPNAVVYQKERSKKSAKNYHAVDSSVRFDDARVRELMQLKRETQFGSDQDQPQSSLVVPTRSKDHATRNHHHHPPPPQSAGNKSDGEQFRKESRSYVQSSGDEKEGVAHLRSPAPAVAKKDSNHHRHQFSGDEHVHGDKVRKEQVDRSFQSSGDEKEAHLRSLAVAKKDVAYRHLHQQHYHQLSGDEHVDVEKYRKERRSSCQSSGDEKRFAAVVARKDPPHRHHPHHHHHHHHHHQSSGDEHVDSEIKSRKAEGGRSSLQSSGDEKEGFRYSSATEKYRHEEDSRDIDSRPQYPSDSKELVRSWNSTEGRRNHVIHESQRYQSSGDEVESERLYHEAYIAPVPAERESHRNQFPVERDDLRQQHHLMTGDGGSDGASFESSEEERGGPQRPSYSSAQRREAAARRHHHGSSGNERGGHRYYSSEDRSEATGRRSHHQGHVSAGRPQAHRSAEKYSGDERGSGHRYHTGRDFHHKVGPTANHRGHRSQAPVEVQERHRYVNSSGDERGGYRYANSTSSRGHKHKSSSGGLDWRLYQSSGDERGGRRSSHLPSAREKELGLKRHSSSADTNNRRRHELSGEVLKEDWPGQYSRAKNRSNDDRRYSIEASDVQRPFSLDAAEELGSRFDSRLSESNYEVRSRNQSSVREEQQYATDTRDNLQRHQQKQLPISDRNIDDSRGGHHHRRQSSASNSKETLRPQSPGEKDASMRSRDLPPRSSGSRIIVSPKNLVDIKGLTIRVRDGVQKEPTWEFDKPAKSPQTGQYAMDARANYELQEMMRDVDRESQWRDHGTRHQASADERDPPRTSSVSRVSADSRQYQSSTPRISVDGREHLRASSLHSSRPSSVDAHSQPRTNSFDSNSSTWECRRRGGGSSSVVARLMGLPELPDSDGTTSTERNATSRTGGKSLQKLSFNSVPPPELAFDQRQLRLSEVALQMKQVAEQFHEDAQLRQTMQLQESDSSAGPKRKISGKSMSDIPRSHSPPLPSGAQDAQNALKQQGTASASPSVSLGRQAEVGSVHRPRVPKQPKSPKHYQMEGMPNVFRKHTQDFPMSPRHHQMEGMPNALRKHTQDLPMSPKYHQMEGVPKQPMSPKHHQMEGMPNAFRKHTQDLSHIEVDQRLHQLRIKNAIQEHKSLKQILEAMHLKGLLHPPQRKPPPAATLSKEQKRLPREEAAAHPFLQHAEKPNNKSQNTPSGNSTRPHRPSRQELSGFPKIVMKDMKVKVPEVVPPPEIDHTKEASIVLMKPFNHHAAIEEIGDRPSSSQLLASGIGRNSPSEIRSRGRSSESRPGFSSGRNSRSAEQFTMRKGPPDDLSFANVMLSWRERVANEAAKKATSVVKHPAAADDEPSEAVSQAKSLPPFTFNQCSKDLSPSRSASASIRSVSRWQTPQKLEVPRTQPVESPAVPTTASKFSEAVEEDLHLDLENSRNNGPMLASADELAIGSTTSFPTVPSSVLIESKHSMESCPTETCNEPESSENTRDSRPKAELFSSSTANVVLPNFKVTTKKRKIEEPAVLMNLEELAKELVVVPGTHQKMHALSEVNVGSETSATDIPEATAAQGGLELGNASSSGGFSLQECFVPKAPSSQEEREFLPQLGADYPSPVSVLDNPIFQEGFFPVDEELSPSPNPMELCSTQHQEGAELGFGNNDIAATRHEEDKAKFVASPSSCVMTEDISIHPVKDIHNSLLEPNIPCLTDSPKHHPHQFEGSNDERNNEAAYVEDILKKSGLTEETSQLGEDITELVHNHVFISKEKELQSAELNRIVDRGELDKSEVKRYKESLDRKLIFDSMNEILGRKMSPFLHPRPWGSPVVQKKPFGRHLVDDVLEELRAMRWPATDLYDGISSLLQRDFRRKEFQWLDFGVEIGEVGIQLEGMLFQDMVEETLQDVMAIISARKQSRLPTPPSPKMPSPPSAMNDSETRRRELLEKTRRDLFAWHVQYQQLA